MASELFHAPQDFLRSQLKKRGLVIYDRTPSGVKIWRIDEQRIYLRSDGILNFSFFVDFYIIKVLTENNVLFAFSFIFIIFRSSNNLKLGDYFIVT